MVKNAYEHHQPRDIAKPKKVKAFEDFNDERGPKVSFKSYLRQVREEEAADDELHGSSDSAFDLLTEDDEAALILEFKEWSGGKDPLDCDDGDLTVFSHEAAPNNFDPVDVLAFLRSYTGE